jgi:excisionase family DNA binding protein
MGFPDLPQKAQLLVAEAARFLGMSEKTVRRWHRAGLIKGTRVNGSPRIDRESLLELVHESGSGKQDAGETPKRS